MNILKLKFAFKNQNSTFAVKNYCSISIALLLLSMMSACSSSKEPNLQPVVQKADDESAKTKTVPASLNKSATVNEEHMSISGPFKTPQDVTKKCLECHEDTGSDILMSKHWRWATKSKLADGTTLEYGKSNIMNNCCISLDGNHPRCTSCHIGFGWKDSSFDMNNPRNIDCLVCHDTTGTYKKFPTAAGYPATEKKTFGGKEFTPPDYDMIVKNVGKTSRETCGSCHFFGGGGNGVKHADLDNSLLKPTGDLDIHMGKLDMSCADCHKSENHKIAGSLFTPVPRSAQETPLACEKCHEDTKHTKMIERHLSSVACETCHIPKIARGNPTKVFWDWSTAGKDLETTTDEYGKPLWVKKKGSFRWNKNFIPSYAWSNGAQDIALKGQKIKLTDGVFVLHKQLGSISDSESKIMPFKIGSGKQPFDAKNNILITPKLFGKTGFWKTFDWDQSAREGMAAAGLKYSGSMGWVDTQMYWPVHHQVAPKEQTLRCNDCHSENGRMDWKALGYEGDPKKTGSRKLKK